MPWRDLNNGVMLGGWGGKGIAQGGGALGEGRQHPGISQGLPGVGSSMTVGGGRPGCSWGE